MSVERQIRILLRAWPLRDRSKRGDEIVGTTLDVLPEGAARLPFLLALNLIVGGMRARWRMRLPLRIWVRRTGRAALVTGLAVVALLVGLVIFLFISLRFFPHEVLSSSSCSYSPPAHSCSPPRATMGRGLGSTYRWPSRRDSGGGHLSPTQSTHFKSDSGLTDDRAFLTRRPVG